MGAFKKGTHIFELVGPERTIESARAQFEEMLASMTRE